MEDMVNNLNSNDGLEYIEEKPIDILKIRKSDFEISEIIK